ncbi:MAG TPA: hypothetical protein VE136_08365 [Anaerolineales bacterium]|nr:hypothetical protein [Anaerolineales bacterium]
MTKITDFIKKMSLEEKAALCTGAGPLPTSPEEMLDELLAKAYSMA